MSVECLEWQDLTPADALQVGELTFATWGPKDKPDARPSPAGNYADYSGPANRRPRRFVVRDGGRIVSHGSVFARVIDVAGRRYTAAALGGVCTYPEYRGKGYAGEVVRAVFELVDRGDFDLCLFQTGLPGFYEKLGCRRISNRIVNSLGADPDKYPLWEDHVMIYPSSLTLPDGTLDLLGPGTNPEMLGRGRRLEVNVRGTPFLGYTKMEGRMTNMMITRLLCVAVAFVLVFAGVAHAAITLPPVISDHMVIQADTAAPIFGTAAPGEAITVEIKGQTHKAVADASGKWLVKLDPLAAGGPLELKVSGTNTITVTDVLVGEVWVASGQSNMAMTLGRCTDAAVAAKANYPTIRYLRHYADTPEFVRMKWVVVTPKIAPLMSGACYYFATDLQEKHKGPIGIIDNSVSGAIGKSFLSKEALERDPKLAALLNTKEFGENFEGGFRSLIPYSIRGVLWYQGEGDRGAADVYASILPALINDWRTHWKNENLPVIVVQLANAFAKTAEPRGGEDCQLRDVQLKTVQKTKDTALVVTIDIGVEDVHYPNKKVLGERLAIAARGLAYGEKMEISGPIFDAARFEDGKAVVSFTHTGGGLVAKGGTLTGFALSGADGKWVRAEAKIDGQTVVVTSAKVPAPTAVRYAWEKNPDCNLYSKEGLPASPFGS